MIALLTALVVAGAPPNEALLRSFVAEAALAQASKIDPAWHPDQRDCAGLVRFAYRAAFKRLAPERLEAGLWLGEGGRPSPFADAEALLARSFVPLGRDERTRAALQSGDLVAFRQAREADLGVYHLMLVVRAIDPAHAATRVVYHPGEAGSAVRTGTLEALAREAPGEWKPVPENPNFLGFYRFKEWTR